MTSIEMRGGLHAVVDDDVAASLAGKRVFLRNGYPCVRRGKRDYYLHREIMQAPDGLTVDHISGDRLDNRRSNLRVCTTQQNTWNRRKKASPSTSVYVGVSFDRHKGKWKAAIREDGRGVTLGYFDSEEEAAAAYQTAALRVRGQFTTGSGIWVVRPAHVAIGLPEHAALRIAEGVEP